MLQLLRHVQQGRSHNIQLCSQHVGTYALEAIEMALRDKLSDAQGRAEGEGLKLAVDNASEAVGTFAASMRPCMQVINASQGIPPTVQFAFDYYREKMFIIKTTVDSEFLIH